MYAMNQNDNSEHSDGCCCPVHEAGSKVRKFATHTAQDARDALASTQKQIRKHPVKASAIAAGIGFVLGAFFRRR